MLVATYKYTVPWDDRLDFIRFILSGETILTCNAGIVLTAKRVIGIELNRLLSEVTAIIEVEYR